MKKISYEDINSAIDEIISVYKKGGIIILPTDTQYGMTALFNNKKAIDRVYFFKKRDLKKSFIHLVSSFDMARRLAFINNYIDILKKNWPGPITFILKKKPNSGIIDRSALSTIGIRFPAEPILCKIISFLNEPIIAPSANISNFEPIRTEIDINKQFGDKINIFIEKKNYKNVRASTLVDLTGSKPIILRKGEQELAL